MTFSQPAPQLGPAPTRRLRGRSPLRLSFVFLALAIIAVVVGALLLVSGYSSTIRGFQRVSFADGSGSVELHSGNYVGYVETPGLSNGNVQMRILSTLGSTIPIENYGENGTDTTTLTYDYDGRHGQALFKFTIPTTGSYEVQILATGLPSGSDMALGRSIAGTLVTGVLLIAGGVLMFIVFVVLLIIGLVMRSNSKRELANAYSGAPWGSGQHPVYRSHPGYGASPGYGAQPGYGQQPPNYPPPNYQQPNYPPPNYQQPNYPPPNYPPPAYQPPTDPPAGEAPVDFSKKSDPPPSEPPS